MAAQYEVLRTGVGAVELERDFLEVKGPQALEYLQGQLSQDVEPLAIGDAALSFLLEPQGKVVALLRVVRVADDVFVLDVDAGHGAAVSERLNRFKLRTKVTIEPLAWRCVGLRGPDATGHAHAHVPTGGALIVVPVDWPGLAGVDVIGPDIAAPLEVPRVDKAYEVARIEAGIPKMGAELTDRTIPAETGIVDRAVSFTKGCYTGQELVARIDARGGNVPRQLRGVVVAHSDPPPAGAAITAGDKNIGWVTSAAPRPGGDAVALAYIQRGNEPPLDAEVTWDGASAAARVEALPLIS